MTLSAVATRYANALADVVTAPGGSQGAPELAELRAFEAAMKESPELQNALTTPAIPLGRKRAVVARLADALGLSRTSRNFLFVLIDKRRIASLADILQAFELVLEERLGFARAEITSARELDDKQQASLNLELEKLTGKRIRMRFTVDGALIGGVVARIGSTVYDGSVRGQLGSMQRRLSAEA
jgi:F-type H+-transporting ATPase subunit delta